MIHFVDRLKWIVSGVLPAFLIGVWFGWYEHGLYQDGKTVENLIDVQSETANNIVNSQKTNNVLEERSRQLNTEAIETKKKVAASLDKVKNDEKNCTIDDVFIDADTVRMLNSQRMSGQSVTGPSGERDAEGETIASAPVSLRLFIDTDIDTVRQCKDLGNNHNALVDWVNDNVVDKQASR